MSEGVRPELREEDFGWWECSECDWRSSLEAKALFRAWRSHLNAMHPEWNHSTLTERARRTVPPPGGGYRPNRFIE